MYHHQQTSNNSFFMNSMTKISPLPSTKNSFHTSYHQFQNYPSTAILRHGATIATPTPRISPKLSPSPHPPTKTSPPRKENPTKPLSSFPKPFQPLFFQPRNLFPSGGAISPRQRYIASLALLRIALGRNPPWEGDVYASKSLETEGTRHEEK